MAHDIRPLVSRMQQCKQWGRSCLVLSYLPFVRDAIVEIARLGKGALLAKVDVKSAFRIVPVHPEAGFFLA